MSPTPELNPVRIVEILNRHQVRYVIIGGIAAQLQDLPVPATIDIDLTPARDNENLEHLAAAFDELDAMLYSADEGGTWFPRHPVEYWAQYDTLHLISNHGPLDIVFVPDGAPGGFDALAPAALEVSIDTEPVLVIAPATWVALKEASGRAKDLEHLNHYYERRDNT